MFPIVLTILAGILATAGCGGHGDGEPGPAQGAASLDQVLAELEGMATPEGVEAALFADMQKELARVLTQNATEWESRGVSRVGSFQRLKLEFADDGELLHLNWNGQITGDYDRNGTVTLSDITPIALNFGMDQTEPDFPWWVNGDNNPEINIADLTPLGIGFGSSISRFQLQSTHTPADELSWITVADLDYGDADNERNFSYMVPDPCAGLHFRLVPLDTNLEPGTPYYPNNGIVDIIGEVEIPQTGSISGTVLSADDGLPLAASILIPGLDPLQTDANGRFSVSALEPALRLAVQVQAEGYQDGNAVYSVVAGASRDQEISMLPRVPGQVINADSGGAILASAQMSLIIPPASLVDSIGTALSGDVNVQFSYINPTSETDMAAAPGDFCARQLDESTAILESYGMVEVFIDDGTGQGANLAPGATAPVTFPIQPEQQATAPETMPLYSFDDETGLWIEEGVVTKSPDGKSYQGELTHFSQWNCDQPLITTCIEVTVLDTLARPIGGALVEVVGLDYTGRSSAFTDGKGVAHLPCRIDSDVEISASYGENIGGGSYHTPAEQMLCDHTQPGVDFGDIVLDGTINFAPTAVLTASAYGGSVPFTVDFDASGSRDPNEDDLLTYEMDFDGLSGPLDWEVQSGPLFSHTYLEKGHYLAMLRVTDSGGLVSTATILVCVQ